MYKSRSALQSLVSEFHNCFRLLQESGIWQQHNTITSASHKEPDTGLVYDRRFSVMLGVVHLLQAAPRNSLLWNSAVLCYDCSWSWSRGFAFRCYKSHVLFPSDRHHCHYQYTMSKSRFRILSFQYYWYGFIIYQTQELIRLLSIINYSSRLKLVCLVFKLTF